MQVSKLIISPIFENWVERYIPRKKLIMCAPYIKEGAIKQVFDHFGISNNNEIEITIITTSVPTVYSSRSSDISVMSFFSKIDNLRVFLIDNLHMKAFCIDNEILLVGSGNLTDSGLGHTPYGNIEAGIETKDKETIDAFLLYSETVKSNSVVLDTKEKIIGFYDDTRKWIDANTDMIEELDLGTKELSSKIVLRFGRRMKIGIGVKRVPKIPEKMGFNPNSIDTMRQIAFMTGKIDLLSPTPEMAYFLGGIFIRGADTYLYRDQTYVYHFVRYNSQGQNQENIRRLSDHREAVIEIASSFCEEIAYHTAKDIEDKIIFSSKSHIGFVTAFPLEKNMEQSDIIKVIAETVVNSEIDIIRAFLIGVFDSRGYIDGNFGYVGVDIDNSYQQDILSILFEKLGLPPANINRERERGNAMPRKTQFRSKFKDYCQNLGLISPIKIDQILSSKFVSKGSFGGEITDDDLLPGLKRIL